MLFRSARWTELRPILQQLGVAEKWGRPTDAGFSGPGRWPGRYGRPQLCPVPMATPSDATAPGDALSSAAEAGASAGGFEDAPFHIGQAVRLRHGLPYLRSADPMPMLRPADLVDRQEVGQVQELRGLGRLAVRFRRGSFLLDAADLEAVSDG